MKFFFVTLSSTPLFVEFPIIIIIIIIIIILSIK